MRTKMLYVLKKAIDCNFTDFEMYRDEKNIDMIKVYLEYIIDNANDISKYATELLEYMEKSDK